MTDTATVETLAAKMSEELAGTPFGSFPEDVRQGWRLVARYVLQSEGELRERLDTSEAEIQTWKQRFEVQNDALRALRAAARQAGYHPDDLTP